MIISHNPGTNITLVLVLAQTKYDGFEKIKSWFYDLEDWHLHPLAIVAILTHRVAGICFTSTDTADRRLNFLQLRMGQHTYHNRVRGDPLKMDFTWVTRTLNHQSTVLAMNKMRLKAVQNTVGKVRLFEKSFKGLGESTRRSREESREEQSLNIQEQIPRQRKFEEILENVEDQVDHLLLRVDYEQQRVQTQLAAVS